MSIFEKPYYLRIKEELYELIRSSDDSLEKLPPVREMMKHYKTSQSVIERCLEELEKDRLIERKRGSGVFIRRDQLKRTRRSRTIGVLVGSYLDAAQALSLSGINLQAMRDHYATVVCCHGSDEESDLFKYVVDRDLDGFIVMATSWELGNADYIAAVNEIQSTRQCPFVFVGYQVPGVVGDIVALDNQGGAERGMNILLSEGVKNLTVIACPHSHNSVERLRGVEKAAAANDAELNFQYIERLDHNNRSRFAEILQDPGDAIFLLTPNHLDSLLTECWKQGIPPGKDVKIASFVEENYKRRLDEDFIPLLKPSRVIGQRAFEILRGRIEGKIKGHAIIERLEVIDETA